MQARLENEWFSIFRLPLLEPLCVVSGRGRERSGTGVVMRDSRRQIPLVIAALVGALAHSAGEAQTCGVDSLVADWSNVSNPNGVWSYNAGDEPLPYVEAWRRNLGSFGYPQPGWARSEETDTRIPFFYQSNGTETFENDIERCDVVVHSQDDNVGVGNGPANLVWTAPSSATVSIRGAVWLARDIGRSNDWKLYHNETLLSQGSLTSDDVYSRVEPFPFADGSGGIAAITDIAVEEGDQLRLELVRTSDSGELVGVRMRIVCGDVSDTTTTTTLQPACGDPIFDEDVKASDALYALRAAVDLLECELCLCDANDTGMVTATDALNILRVAVGQAGSLVCPPCGC
jgi:hypothetical protein